MLLGKRMPAILLVLLAGLSLYGCSSPDKEPDNVAAEKYNLSSAFETQEDSKGSGSDSTEAKGGVRPEYLPGDLPILAGASIVSSGGTTVSGKKSAILIYETKQSMVTVGSVYKQYVKDKHLPQDTQIVDGSNVLIHGKAEGNYSYSIIGSSLPSKPGTVEVIVGWVED
jgi:hypothetical protein